MRLRLALLPLLVIISLSAFASAQEQSAWIPQDIQHLQQTASSKSGFTFDHSMLVLASKLDPHDPDLRRVIAGISGISVQNYRFASPGQYDLNARSVDKEYKAAGWTKLLNKHHQNGVDGTTDLWVRMENNAISNVAILLARPHEVSFVAISGSISPADLSRLSGHFGIPTSEGGVVVPNPSTR
ncbi:MAG: DUF4252 domain-containing protein [Candidatus Sulfotelmatobacter sp.]